MRVPLQKGADLIHRLQKPGRLWGNHCYSHLSHHAGLSTAAHTAAPVSRAPYAPPQDSPKTPVPFSAFSTLRACVTADTGAQVF